MGAASVHVGTSESGWRELLPDTSISGLSISAAGTPVFAGDVLVPRAPVAHVRAVTPDGRSVILATLDVAPQVQHIVPYVAPPPPVDPLPKTPSKVRIGYHGFQRS